MRLSSLRAAAALLLATAGLAAPAAAQTSAPVDVQWLSERNFAVHVVGEDGTTEAQAERMARTRACEIGRERGYTHLAVAEFRSSLESRRVVTREARDAFRIVDGQSRVIGRDPALHGTVTWANAVLMVTLANAEGADMLRRAMEFIRVENCKVIPKASR